MLQSARPPSQSISVPSLALFVHERCACDLKGTDTSRPRNISRFP